MRAVLGNVLSKTVNGSVTTYGYDNANELASETGPSYTGSYTYDGNGNRLTKALNGVTDTYNYGTADKLTSITEGSTTVKSYTYDAAGRTTSVTTSSGTTNLAYDYEDRLTSISGPGGLSDTFTYNGLDTRVGKVDASGTHSYRRDGVNPVSPLLNDGSAEYTPGISRSSTSGTVFYGSDRMGSNVIQTNGSQSVTSTAQFDGFGSLVSSSGTPQGPFGFNGQYGYQSDSDDGLMLLGHRYYDSSTGRFLTRDPIKDGQNWYEYCANNPLGYIDENGGFAIGLGDLWKIIKYPLPVILPPGFWKWLNGHLKWHHHHHSAPISKIDPPTIWIGNPPKEIHPKDDGHPIYIPPGTVFDPGGWTVVQNPPNGVILLPPGAHPKNPTSQPGSGQSVKV